MKTPFNQTVLALGLALLGTSTRAQDPVKIAPGTYKVLVDNPRIRLLEVSLPPGGKSAMHSHPQLVIYSLNSSKVRFTFPDHTSKEVEMNTGDVVWCEKLTHGVENIGNTPARVLNLELKESRGMAAAPIKTEMDAVNVNPGKYKAILDNAHVRVLEFRDQPGDKAAMHSHPDNIVYAVNALKRRFTFPDGKARDISLQAGEALFAKAETHAGENIGATPTHVVIFELKSEPQSDQQTRSGTEAGFMAARFEDLKWEKMFPDLGADSPEVNVLRVDPKTQATQLLIRTPTAMHVPKHWHSGNETHTMIKGTGTFECEGQQVALGPGSFNYMPSHMVHQAWASGGAVVFITVDQAWDINWVDGPPKRSDFGVSPPPTATGLPARP